MADQRTNATELEVCEQPLGYIAGLSFPQEPQGHSSGSSQAQQLDIGMETHKPVLHRQLQFANRDTFSSNQINLWPLEYQERVSSLNRGIEWKEEALQRLRALLAQRDTQLLSAHHPVTMPSTQLVSTWLEVQAAKTRLMEFQTMREEEAAQKVRLQGQIQHLNHQLEAQSERHSKELQTMNKRIEKSKVLVQQLDEQIGEGYDQAALKTVLESLRDKAEFELGMFQEDITEAYNQNLATLIALQSSDQILLDHEESENRQLHQCTKDLRQQVTVLHNKVLSEEAQCQMLAGMFEQERHYNQHCLPALQQQIEVLWQRLRELDERSAVQTRPLLSQDENEMVTRQRAGGENRLHQELADWFCKSSGEDCSETRGQTESDGRSPDFRVKEESEDSHTTQESSTVKNSASSHLTVNGNPAMSSETTCVKIEEVDCKGCFVRLFNTSPDKNVDLSGYTLQQRIGVYPISLYRFPQHTWLPNLRYLTVWAEAADISQRLPSDIVWREQHRFQSGPQCTTALCKSNGQTIAWYIPSHRFSAAANSFDVKDDASDECVPVPLNKQQTSPAGSPQEQCMKEEGWAPSPEIMIQPDAQINSWTDFVPVQKRGSISALLSSKGARRQSNTSSLTEHSSLWSHSMGETDIFSYLQSSLISLPSDSLPGLVTPDSSSPQSPIQMSRRSSDAEGLHLTVAPSRLDKARLLTGRVTPRNTRAKYGLRFMSYPLFTMDTHVTRR
ncbi:lamin-A-like [Scyliorhinus torazame]|uniref:lamin-A-like n=1 Tax=Scyliorhinus torazame TaxID=75743 RepID=UPI003B5C76A3